MDTEQPDNNTQPNPESISEESIGEILDYMEKEIGDVSPFVSPTDLTSKSEAKLTAPEKSDNENEDDELDPESIPIEAMQAAFGMMSDLFAKWSKGEGAMGGQVDWEIVENMASGGTIGKEESEIKDSNKTRLYELYKLAAMHIDLALAGKSSTDREPSVMRRSDWAISSVKKLKTILSPITEPDISEIKEMHEGNRAKMEIFEKGMLATFIMLIIAGEINTLSKTAFGNSALPVPSHIHSDYSNVPVVESTILKFAQNNDLDMDEAALWACCFEILYDKILSKKHVGDALYPLCESYVDEMDTRMSGGFISSLGDPEDLLREAEEGISGNAEEIFENIMETMPETSTQTQISSKISAIVSVIAGYTHFFSARITNSILGDSSHLSDAFIELDRNSSICRHVFGIDTDIDAGLSFITEADYHGGLDKLWESEETLPTPEEVEKPSLWLQRMNLESV